MVKKFSRVSPRLTVPAVLNARGLGGDAKPDRAARR
jgi:hypothetical protein